MIACALKLRLFGLLALDGLFLFGFGDKYFIKQNMINQTYNSQAGAQSFALGLIV